MREEPSKPYCLTVTANALLSNRPCIITALSLSPSAAACVVNLYELPKPSSAVITTQGNATTVGATLVARLTAPASVASTCLPLPSGMEFLNGCIAEVTGAGAVANVSVAVI